MGANGSEASATAIGHYDASHGTAMVTPQVRYLNNGVEQDHGAVKRIVRGTIWLLSSGQTAGYICSPMSTPNALIRGTALASCARVGFHNPLKSFWLFEVILQGEGAIALNPYDACQGGFHLLGGKTQCHNGGSIAMKVQAKRNIMIVLTALAQIASFACANDFEISAPKNRASYLGISDAHPTGSPSISRDGLVAAYDMETLTEGGVFKDFSGNNNHGTIHQTKLVKGIFGKARQFERLHPPAEEPDLCP
jgi:hypothetical protein